MNIGTHRVQAAGNIGMETCGASVISDGMARSTSHNTTGTMGFVVVKSLENPGQERIRAGKLYQFGQEKWAGEHE